MAASEDQDDWLESVRWRLLHHPLPSDGTVTVVDTEHQTVDGRCAGAWGLRNPFISGV
jgi:hypothetical protein